MSDAQDDGTAVDIELDAAGFVTHWPAQAVALFGLPASAVLGQPLPWLLDDRQDPTHAQAVTLPNDGEALRLLVERPDASGQPRRLWMTLRRRHDAPLARPVGRPRPAPAGRADAQRRRPLARRSHGAGPRGAPAAAGREPGAGRLWHGLLQPGLPQALSDSHAQNRPLLRHRHSAPDQRRCHRPRDRDHGAAVAPGDRRGRGRDRRADAISARARLRPTAGLSVQPPGGLGHLRNPGAARPTPASGSPHS